MRSSRSAPARISTILALTLVGIAIVFRIHALGRVPGINADEAWYGVQAGRIAAGDGAWRTPHGNLVSPLQVGTLVILHAFLPHSFLLLRIPSLLASLGAMALAYAIGRRFFDHASAIALLLLSAALPVTIAYARFGWDPSWDVLVVLAATWFALAGRPLGTALLFLLALIVHPTNLFVAPFLLLTFAGAAAQQAGRSDGVRRAALLAVAMLASVALLSVSTAGGRAEVVAGFASRLVDPAAWLAFVILYGRLLSGDSIYSFVAGEGFGRMQPLADVGALILLSLLVILGGRAVAGGRDKRAIGIVAGWAAGLAIFYLIAGNVAIGVVNGRFAFPLVAPSLIALVTLARPLAGNRLVPVAATLAAVLLAGFADRYFGTIARTGSTASASFWTGEEEPKQVAFARVLAEATPRGGARVVAGDYWLYWPLAYLAAGTPIAVSQAGDLAPRPLPGGTYAVAFAGTPFDAAMARDRRARLRWTIPGTARPAAIRIWWSP